jgi:hypothetical protein
MPNPVLDQLKTRATGYIGSKFVGVPGQPAAPAPAAPASVSPTAAPSVSPPPPPTTGPRTLATGWRGSQYIGAPASTPQVQPAQATTPAGSVPPAPQAGASPDQAWLDWIAKTYGNSASRGGGFADLPQGQNLESVINRFNQETGGSARYLGGPSGDRVDFGQGVTDALTGTGQLWSDYGAMGGQARAGAGVPNATMRAGGGGGSGSGGGVGAAAGGAAGGAAGSDWQTQIRAMLMEQMKGYAKPVGMDDPGIQGEMQAQERTLERGRQDRRAAMAERNAASGLNSGGAGSGAMDAEIAAGYEDKGAAKTGLQAQLYSRELSARRDKMMQSLQLALQTGDAESARALQLKMSQMDNELQRMGLSQRQSQWNDSYGIDKGRFDYERDRDAARAKAGMNF